METVKNFIHRYATVIFIVGMTFVSAFLLYIGFVYFIEFSAFAVVLAMVTVVITLFVLADKALMPGVDTLTEIKEGNVAVALTLLAIAVLILACVQFV